MPSRWLPMVPRPSRPSSKSFHRSFLLDMRMPVMDGWEFAIELRARAIEVPIIVMPAAEDAQSCADEIGASAYVTKPISLPALIARIDALFQYPGAQP